MSRPVLIRLCFALSFMLLSPAPVYAQEELSEEPAPASTSCPTCTKCGDAEQGTAGDTEGGYCDFYSRQLEYREHSKAYRESIEKRRAAFEAPRIQALEAFRKKREELYKQESKDYQAQLAREAEEAEAALAAKDEAGADQAAEGQDGATETASVSEGMEGAVGEEGQAAASDEAAPAEGVKEKVIEESDSETKPRKKIIMPEDAPDF